LVTICRESKADTFLSGPAAKEYIKEDLFKNANISIVWLDYSGYKEYSQLFPPSNHNVSIIDLLLNEGMNAKCFLKSYKQSEL